MTVKYNHYKEKFGIINGVLKEEDISEEYSFNYAFRGNYKMLLREEKD